jgi:hypothetical protein
MENNYRTGEVTQLRRIADALEEILRMVKKDQEDAGARRKQYERIKHNDLVPLFHSGPWHAAARLPEQL